MTSSASFPPTDTFVRRHIGPREADLNGMLETLGLSSLDALIDESVPAAIRLERELTLGDERSESELLEELRAIAKKNEVYRSFIGCGYYGTMTPAVIQRNILENPGWYTQYTPYQAEIAQGRLEALINFQSMVADLTGLPLANASLLDEATAAAEAMNLCYAAGRRKRSRFFASSDCHPQTLAVLQTRAKPLGLEVQIGDANGIEFGDDLCGVLLQTPTTDGRVLDLSALADKAHAAGAMVIVACDLLALTMHKSPGEMGADVAIGSSQRFGVPMGYGGPHAAFLSTSEKYKRQIPGRIIGVSKDARGRVAYRLALQTREQHIRRDKATSNICTAQVLLAIMAGAYAVYHGPEGLRGIASRVQHMTVALRDGLRAMGYELGDGPVFDTLKVIADADGRAKINAEADKRRFNLRQFDDGVGISLDETCGDAELTLLLGAFGAAAGKESASVATLAEAATPGFEGELARSSSYLEHECFNRYHSEHEMLRYLHRLQSKDLSLTTSMIALGSCTMKLNASSEMLPITWPEFANMHPFAPASQCQGYKEMTDILEGWLAEITGLAAVSLMPNSGAQGEYAGLLAIRGYQEARGQGHRDVCLIPVSAHGTNPASAVMAGFRVVAVKCDELGNIDIADLRAKAEENKEGLAAIMVTYPSTHGVFEDGIKEICSIVHEFGGQVYVDGANMNAQVGLCRPGDYGADVIHLNLHKTFAIPHGGGGPGIGPIAVADQLVPYLPGHPMLEGEHSVGPVSAAPYGSAGVLPISWMYVGLMGGPGLKRASQVAILNANYMAKRLEGHFDILYRGKKGRVAHEFILDLRPFKKSVGIEVDDVAKRLMDYGFHAPTMSWPVPGTLMVEPTESESREELDRFCDALISIREEIRVIEEGAMDPADNPLKFAPHSPADVCDPDWSRGYSQYLGAFPAPWLEGHKYWPPVSRIDNAFGDRHLVCTCPSVEEMSS